MSYTDICRMKKDSLEKDPSNTNVIAPRINVVNPALRIPVVSTLNNALMGNLLHRPNLTFQRQLYILNISVENMFSINIVFSKSSL